MASLHFEGLLIGIATFLIIGIFHPVIIKMEYHTGTRYWWVLLLAGIIAILVGLFFVANIGLGGRAAELAEKQAQKHQRKVGL